MRLISILGREISGTVTAAINRSPRGGHRIDGATEVTSTATESTALTRWSVCRPGRIASSLAAGYRRSLDGVEVKRARKRRA